MPGDLSLLGCVQHVVQRGLTCYWAGDSGIPRESSSQEYRALCSGESKLSTVINRLINTNDIVAVVPRVGPDSALTLPLLLFDQVGQLSHLVEDRAPLSHQFPDLPVGMNHGGVIAAAEFLPDLRQREIGELTA